MDLVLVYKRCEGKMDKNIFRHDTVERLSSPAQLSKLLVVVRLKGWIILGVVLGIILTIVSWSFSGEIPIITTGKGILLDPKAQVAINSPNTGQVKTIYVKPGQQVLKGAVLIELSTGTMIEAPSSGKVLQLDVGQGNQVKTGQVLLWFEKPVLAKDMLVYAFIPIQAGQRVKKGMDATVNLAAVDTQKYGQLKGQVIEVDPFAVSKNSDQLKVIPSEKLRDDMTSKATAILVLIKPYLEPKNPSQLAWTSGKGPPNELSPGSTGSVRITIESKRPISYLIPGL